MIRWVNFLHIYQPPVQSAYWVKRIANECYLPVLKLLSENPEIRITINISGVLLEHFERLEMHEIFELIDKIKANRNVEFTGSAAYHPILPMLPEEEAMRQIALNEWILEKIGGIKKPDGFFLPEMCFSQAVAEILEKMGYR
ncbi:MAG: polysaccharide deacetylase family protein, partial [Thermoplasmata archaeon]